MEVHMDNPLVSIIIPVKNGATTIGLCIESLAQQVYPRIEVLVVDNGSDDETVSIAQSLGIRVVISGGGLPAARNTGARFAQGEFLLHLDSDMELAAHAVEECVAEAMQGADIIILPERNVAHGYWMQSYSLSKELVDGAPGFENGRFVSRTLFDRVGGYDESLFFGEDRDFFLRTLQAGGHMSRIRSITKHHVEHLMISDIFRKTERYTRTRAAFEQKHASKLISRRWSLPKLIVQRRDVLLRSPGYAIGWITLTLVFFVRDTALRYVVQKQRAQKLGEQA